MIPATMRPSLVLLPVLLLPLDLEDFGEFGDFEDLEIWISAISISEPEKDIVEVVYTLTARVVK